MVTEGLYLSKRGVSTVRIRLLEPLFLQYMQVFVSATKA